MDNLKGQVALVTGAGGGIGMAIVERFAALGANIAVADKDERMLNKTCELIETLGQKYISLPGDLTDDDYCDHLPSKVLNIFGKIDILINNAGFIARGSITDTSDEMFELSMKINVEAPFRLCRATIPIMAKAGGGRIVNTASCWGVYPGPNHLIYCTTKGALAAMTRCLGRDHAHQNIRVNAVCPNEVNTPMLRTGFEVSGLDPQAAIDQLNQSVPLEHIADPKEIADVVVFLSSKESRYMCGSLVEVNGGKPVY